MKLLRTQAEMVQAYRDRIAELGITFSTVDAISGLPDGYTAKLMGPNPIKGLGEKAIEGLNGALGIAFTVTVDPDQVDRVSRRWVQRKRPFFSKRPSVSIPLSIDNEVPTQIQITVDLAAELGSSQYMRMIGLRGNQKRNERTSRWKRKMLARRAAKARWAKMGAAAE